MREAGATSTACSAITGRSRMSSASCARVLSIGAKGEGSMVRANVFLALVTAAVVVGVPMRAQEKKPVPKDSIRVSIPGCSKGMVFTAGARTEDQPGGSGLPEGTHLRMNGPKKLLAE